VRPGYREPLGCPAPALTRTFLPSLAVSPRPPSPAPFRAGSSSRELCVSSRVLRPTACLPRPELPRSRDRLPEAEKRLPGGYFPLRDISKARPLYRASLAGSRVARRSQPRAMVRPRRFSRPRRFTPRLTLRVCFTPQPRPGFPFRGLSLPAEPHALTSAVALLSVERVRLPV